MRQKGVAGERCASRECAAQDQKVRLPNAESRAFGRLQTYLVAAVIAAAAAITVIAAFPA